MTPACFCRAELQRIYDQLGTYRALRDRYGHSMTSWRDWFRALRIRAHKRGGCNFRPSTHRAENLSNGDMALRARPVPKDDYCQERGRRCVVRDLGDCEACRDSYNVARGICGTSLTQAREVGIESAAGGERMPVRRVG